MSLDLQAVDKVLTDAVIREERFDRVLCQQAVNYWLNETTARWVSMVLKPGGVFAFNTFNQKPSEVPRVLRYERDGHHFVEVSCLVGNVVHHYQARDGLKPHATSFRWLSPEHLRKILEPSFTVVEEGLGKTSVYRCEKRSYL